MDLPSTLLVYVCCISCCTVTFGLIYISPSKSLIEQGDSFEVNCTIKPLTNDVEFFLDGVSKGDCIGVVQDIVAGTCSAGLTQDITTEETIFTIASASIFTDQGIWKCSHNGENNQTNINVYNFQTVLNNNQYELPSIIETSSSPNSEFKVFVGCGYPEPIITWTVDKCDGSETGIVVNTPTLTTNTSAGCTSPLVAYTSAIKASDLASPTVETCYTPKATMTYTEKPAVMLPSQFTSNVQFPGPTVTTEMSSTSTSQEQTTSSQHPFNAPFYNTQKTETAVMTTTDNDFTSSSLHSSLEVTTSIKTESDTRTSQDQITSSQNPSVNSFPNLEKTETTIMTTTENDLTSSFLHVSSEVTTSINTESDNLTDLGVTTIIAIAISGFIFLFLIVVLIICSCQYCRKKSKLKTSEEFQEIHDDVVPKFWPNFNRGRYGLNEINGSTVHLARGYNLYQGEHNRGYNFRSKHQSDNYNRSRSERKIITENRKHNQKQVQEKISHGFPQSIPDDIINRHDINGINTYDLHDNQNTRTYYRRHAVSSPRRFEYRGSFLPPEYIDNNRRSSPYMTYLQEHVPRDLEGLTFYQGHNGATNKHSRRYY